jgi:hypothetical protein
MATCRTERKHIGYVTGIALFVGADGGEQVGAPDGRLPGDFRCS